MENNTEKLTPMMQQYFEIKNEYKDYILFYRLGDFYEMFQDDALTASKELELTLTSRAGTPMCGVPYHSSEVYINKLIKKGYKIAVCEQLEEPSQSKGLVKRDVVRLITAGTVYEDSLLEEGSNNFIGSIYVNGDVVGLAFGDISTGEFHVSEKKGKDIDEAVISELARYRPVEILFNEKFLDIKNVQAFITTKLIGAIGELLSEEEFSSTNSDELYQQFLSKSIKEYGLNESVCALNALCGVFRYINKTQKISDKRTIMLSVHSENSYMNINLTTRRNLELCETMRNKEKKGSLLWVLDKTKTSMGKRKLKQYIELPLISQTAILSRFDAVEAFVKNPDISGDISETLHSIYDLERLITRIVCKASSPRDVFSLGKTCSNLPVLKAQLSKIKVRLINNLNDKIFPLNDIATLVENAFKEDDLPANTRDGNYIKDGFNSELDRLRSIKNGSETVLREIEVSERAKTGIKNLRVGYNRVFGYYIEVSKGNVDSVPQNYVRKQTLANGERYITEELKKIESEILGASDKILALEAEIFADIRSYIAGKLCDVQQTAEAVAEVDVLLSFADVAISNNFSRPELTLESVIQIKDGRHPVIEKFLTDGVFTPNDTYLDLNENKLIIITGPNMSGKSTFMRQVAIITLMAQIGSFVPAKYARIGVVDKIFTRVGASDDLTAGQSTFMVEMSEVAEILKNATSKSLVILDEIGRGTSTFDGISIAKSVAEYINAKIGCKTLFATHYHELIALEGENKGIRNFSVAVNKKGDEIKFLHKIVEGGTDDSFGIEVAKLAGLPSKVISRAKEALLQMEKSSKIELAKKFEEAEESEAQVDFSALSKQKVVDIIKQINIDELSPREAMDKLYELKNML